MTEKQLARLYEIACAGASRRPDEDQFEVWKRNLGRFEESEVNAALAVWQADITEVMHFDELRPRGATMPTAADLLSLVRKIQRKKDASTTFQACGIDGCTDGLKLIHRDGVRMVTHCWCYREWKAAKGPIRSASTIDRSLNALVSQIRRVQ